MLRLAPDGYGPALSTTHRVGVTCSAWLGGALVANAVPVLSGDLVENADQAVAESVTFRVPRRDPATGAEWLPDRPDAALAPFGQRVRLSRTMPRQGGDHVVGLGWYRLQDWNRDGDEVEVEAAGLLAVVEGARLLAPTAPPAGATFRSEFVRLVEGLLPVVVSAALVDRAVPTSFAWDEDRLGALLDLAAAWPARVYVDPDGVLRVDPPLDPAAPADVTLVEGDPDLGVILSPSEGGTRDGVANAVVARGEQTDDPARLPVQAIAYLTDPAHPARWGGPFGPQPAFYASPLLTTEAQCLAAAQTRLAALSVRANTLNLTCVPDARLSAVLGSRVDVQRTSGALVRGRVIGVKFPLTAQGGAAEYVLAVL